MNFPRAVTSDPETDVDFEANENQFQISKDLLTSSTSKVPIASSSHVFSQPTKLTVTPYVLDQVIMIFPTHSEFPF